VGCPTEPADENAAIPTGMEELRVRVQQLSLREQIERNHFLLMRLNAANARLIQSLEQGDVFEPSPKSSPICWDPREIAVFDYRAAKKPSSLAWSSGVEAEALQPFLCGAGMFSRAVQQGLSQFQERQQEGVLLPYEKELTACVILKSSREIVGVIAILAFFRRRTIWNGRTTNC